jgi:hypothetical protein
MADTPRTLSALLALLADNTSGNITAQVVRDLTVSLYPSRGQLELASGGAVATTFASSGTYVPVAGTTALDTAVCTSCVSMPANGQLRWEKASTQVLNAQATLEVLPAGNNKRYTFTFAKNGVAIPGLAFTAFFGNLSGNPAGVFLSGLIPIAEDDIISVVVKNDTSTAAITASVLTLGGVGFMT